MELSWKTVYGTFELLCSGNWEKGHSSLFEPRRLCSRTGRCIMKARNRITLKGFGGSMNGFPPDRMAKLSRISNLVSISMIVRDCRNVSICIPFKDMYHTFKRADPF
jgi:hypothetical protein